MWIKAAIKSILALDKLFRGCLMILKIIRYILQRFFVVGAILLAAELPHIEKLFIQERNGSALSLDKFQHLFPFEVKALIEIRTKLLNRPIQPKKITCKLHVSYVFGEGANNIPIAVHGSIPLHLSFTPPSLVIDDNEEIAATLKAAGAVAPIVELFAIKDFAFSGEGALQVDIKGSIHSPSLTGKASLTNGTLESFAFGTFLKEIQVAFEGAGNRIAITSLSASDQTNGRLEGSGTYLMTENHRFALDLRMKDLCLVSLDHMNALFNGELALAGNSEHIDIKGDLESKKFHYKITKKIDEIADAVEVTYINQDAAEPAPTKIQKAQLAQLPINIDLHVKIPKEGLDITDDNLSSFWGGDLLLSGPLHKPKLKGEIKLDRGDYLLNGQRFDLTTGTITLAGDPEKKTSLYVVATRDIGDHRVEIILRGKLENPTIALRSSPALSQQGVLSLILFGKAPAEISQQQDQLLEKSLASLMKGQSGPSVLSKLQKSIGIDRIDINRQETNDRDQLSIQIGKYLTKDVYISLHKGFGNEPTRIGIEAKIRKNLKLQAEAGEAARGSTTSAGGQLSLIWKQDY